MVKKKYIPDKGDIVWLNFDPQKGREQAGTRPALVLSSKLYNKTGLMISCPITSKIKGYPFEVLIEVGKIKGAILTDQIRSLDWQARGLQFISKTPIDLQNRVINRILLLLVRS
jgi:mRNA interferase MazF